VSESGRQEAALRAATHPLPLRAALADWDALAANASRRGASAVASALTAETCAVPDVEGAAGAGPSPARPRHNAWPPRTRALTGAPRGPGCRCQLTTQPRARRFRRATRLNGAAAALFEAIASGSSDRRLPAVRQLVPGSIRFPLLSSGPQRGPDPPPRPQVALDRFDLFHAHMFLARRAPGAAPGLGLLFHAKEYPRRSAAFPVNLGFCQANSTLAFDQRAMDLRNLVFYQARAWPARRLQAHAGVARCNTEGAKADGGRGWPQGALYALDVGEGSPLRDDLLMDGLQVRAPGAHASCPPVDNTLAARAGPMCCATRHAGRAHGPGDRLWRRRVRCELLPLAARPRTGARVHLWRRGRRRRRRCGVNCPRDRCVRACAGNALVTLGALDTCLAGHTVGSLQPSRR